MQLNESGLALSSILMWLSSHNNSTIQPLGSNLEQPRMRFLAENLQGNFPVAGVTSIALRRCDLAGETWQRGQELLKIHLKCLICQSPRSSAISQPPWNPAPCSAAWEGPIEDFKKLMCRKISPPAWAPSLDRDSLLCVGDLPFGVSQHWGATAGTGMSPGCAHLLLPQLHKTRTSSHFPGRRVKSLKNPDHLKAK